MATAFEGDKPHGIQNEGGLRRSVAVVRKQDLRDPHKNAALLCCALIANHPFSDGNHRTSLHAAILQLLFDDWVYTGSVDAERTIYNWRFDYEEKNELEHEWSRIFGGWDVRGEEEHLLALLESPYGQAIEAYLRRHSEPLHEHAMLALPPRFYHSIMRRYPPSPWKKELNRRRRALASRLRKTVWRRMDAILEEKMTERSRPQKHWRAEKL